MSVDLPVLPRVIHTTERQVWKQCRRKYRYAHVLNLVPNDERRGALWFGSGLHYALARYYKDMTPVEDAWEYWLDAKQVPPINWDRLSSEDLKILNDFDNLAQTMLRGYVDFARERDREWEIIAVEEPLNVVVPGTDVIITCTIDLLIRKAGRLWVVDHKGFKSFAEPEQLEYDDQMTVYLWGVWQKYGEHPAGAIYNQLRKAVPCEPMLLKDGTRLSKDKSIDTTPEKYLETILRNGFDPSQYEDILLRLSHNEFYRRETIARGRRELELMTQQLQAEVAEMTNPQIVYYPNPTWDCLWQCSYKSLCKAASSGGDEQSLIDGLFHEELEWSR